MIDPTDARFMALALQLGQRGLGQVWPNPSVGCVIVLGGRIVGRGRTVIGGRPHAEVVALDEAGHNAKNATVYVTLEPCAHYGHTPPCADALIDAGVARVVVAAGDPDPRVAGAGLDKLRAAGIAVMTGVLEEQALRDHAGFLGRVTRKRPFVTLKVATTIDGRIATRTGESRWITGPDARHAVHAMRGRHDGVMVGAGTVRADNPQLTVRGMGERRQPVRVVVTSDLNLPPEAQMFQTTQDAPVWLCHGPAKATAFTDQGAESIPCPLVAGRVDLKAVLTALAEKGLTRIFCEGGASLAASLLAARLVDRLEVFQAGKVIGADGISAAAGMGVTALADAAKFELVQTRQIGVDVLTSWDCL